MSNEIGNDTIKITSALEAEDSNLTSENKAIQETSETLPKNKVVKEMSFLEKWRTNRFWIIKGSYYLLHSIWLIVMSIGAFIAFVISMLFI